MDDVPRITTPEGSAHSFYVSHIGGKNGGGARVGVMLTPHGAMETPCFLPVASFGDLRAISLDDAANCGTQILMVNAWHVYRKAGAKVLEQGGGVHKWMNWQRAVFTDSGGYQIFSLRETSRISDEGVSFTSFEGEATARLTPENVISIQRIVGSDIMTVLDECVPYPSPKKRVRDAMQRTNLWAKRCVKAYQEIPHRYEYEQALWGIVQGGTYEDLRKISVEELAQLNFDGYGIGGLSIGMPRSIMREMTALVCELLPPDKPRHLLGTGLPCDILDGIEDGVDTFDCVLPIRKAQRGIAYTSRGVVRYKSCPHPSVANLPLDPECNCPACRHYSWEQLRHLYRTDKPNASRLVAIHNLSFYNKMFEAAREAIRQNRFVSYKDAFFTKWSSGEMPPP